MKIDATNPSTATVPSKRANAAAGPVFALPNTSAARGAASAQATVAMGSLTGLDALMALQQFDEAGERRKRAAKRATGLLDMLDGLRVALLSDQSPKATAQHLANLLQEHRDSVDDERLDLLLDEIDLRAQVELAKLEMAP